MHGMQDNNHNPINQQILKYLAEGPYREGIAGKVFLSAKVVEKRIRLMKKAAEQRVHRSWGKAFHNAVPGVYLRLKQSRR